jgi:hypothetical protein
MLAVLDWELSTLGHPLADFAYHCMTWRLSPGQFRGLAGNDLAALGIPSEAEYVAAYCRAPGAPRSRPPSGSTASPSTCSASPPSCRASWPARCRATPPARKPSKPASAPARSPKRPGARWKRRYDACSPRESGTDRGSPLFDDEQGNTMDFAHSEKVRELQQRLNAFMDKHIYPKRGRLRRRDRGQPQAKGNPWVPTKIIDELKEKARPPACGTCSCPSRSSAPASPTSNTRRCARSWAARRIAPEVFNCSAPDTGNMEVLVRYGTPEHSSSGCCRCSTARSAPASP